MNLSAYRRVAEGMYADPALTGPLLAIGLNWAHQRHIEGVGKLSAKAAARAVFGEPGTTTIVFGGVPHVYDRADTQFNKVMSDDIRRYRSWLDPRNSIHVVRPCEAPMVRRDGLCGKPASGREDIYDLATGERYGVARCGRHIQWACELTRDNHRVWRAIPEDKRPIPPANSGGVLRRHLPELDWPAYWLRLDPGWVEPPEREPFVRPTLTVLITDDVEPSPEGPRAALTLVPS